MLRSFKKALFESCSVKFPTLQRNLLHPLSTSPREFIRLRNAQGRVVLRKLETSHARSLTSPSPAAISRRRGR